MELHREMAAARLDAALNDRDLRDLRAAAGAEAAGIKGGGNGGGGGGAGSVRAATIDNCQVGILRAVRGADAAADLVAFAALVAEDGTVWLGGSKKGAARLASTTANRRPWPWLMAAKPYWQARHAFQPLLVWRQPSPFFSLRACFLGPCLPRARSLIWWWPH
jgi:hypothetical protein